MSKMDGIISVDFQTGEIIDNKIIDAVRTEEYKKELSKLYFILENNPEDLTLNQLNIIRKHKGLDNKDIKIDFQDSGYVIVKKCEYAHLLSKDTKSLIFDLQQMTSYDGRLLSENNQEISTYEQLYTKLNIPRSTWSKNIKPDIDKFQILAKEKINNMSFILLNPIFGHNRNLILNEQITSLFFTDICINIEYFKKYITDIKTFELIKNNIDKNSLFYLQLKICPNNVYSISSQPTNISGIYF